MSETPHDKINTSSKSEWSVIDGLLEAKGSGETEQSVRSQVTELVQSEVIPEEECQNYRRRAFAAQYYLRPENSWLRQAPKFEDKWRAVSWLVREKKAAGDDKAVETLMRSLEYGEKVPRDNPQYHYAAAAADRASSEYIQELVEGTKDGLSFCKYLKDHWQQEVRAKIKETYHQNRPPETPWSQSYCYDVRRAAKAYLETEENIDSSSTREEQDPAQDEEKGWKDFFD